MQRNASAWTGKGMTDEGAPLAVDLAFNGGPERIAEVAREVERREDAGVRGLFVSEARHDPFLSLTLAAVETERLHLGTAIALAFARTPMSMAYTAYDLHRISGGRLVLGLGSQIKAHIVRRYDMPWSQPAERMRDYVSALRAIWHSWQTGEALDYRGEFYTHTLMPPLFSSGPLGFPSPEVWVAAVGPRMVEAAAMVADGMICHPLISQSYLADVIAPQVSAARAASDRRDDPFTFSAMGMVATGHTEEALADAIAATRRQIGFYASTPAYKGMLEHHGWGDLHPTAHAMSKAGQWAELAGLIDDDILNTFAVVGEPAVAGRLLRERFTGLVERVTVSMPPHLEASLALDMLAAVPSD
jgi:probable F420-dependent oxidoreductase